MDNINQPNINIQLVHTIFQASGTQLKKPVRDEDVTMGSGTPAVNRHTVSTWPSSVMGVPAVVRWWLSGQHAGTVLTALMIVRMKK